MDNFELKTEPKVNQKPIIWNILTVIVLLGICGLVYTFLAIFLNPARHGSRKLTPCLTSHPLPDTDPHGYHHPAACYLDTYPDHPAFRNAYQGSHLDIGCDADHG